MLPYIFIFKFFLAILEFIPYLTYSYKNRGVRILSYYLVRELC